MRDKILKILNEKLDLTDILNKNSLPEKIHFYMDRCGIKTQATLARKSFVSPATVNRMCKYLVADEPRIIHDYVTVWSISMALKLSDEERYELFCIANPREAILRILEPYRLSLDEFDAVLNELNLNTLNKNK